MKEGVIPTTNTLHVVKYGQNFKDEFIANQNVHQVHVPLDWLKGTTVVDTPGTNAIIREHQNITEHFVPRSDLVLFITSSERPFSDSEREFMKSIKDWGKKVVVILNKVDVLNEEQQVVVKEFVTEGISSLLEFSPELFPVSARSALESKMHDREVDDNWKALERFIFDMLKNEKIRIKLQSPIGVSEKIIEKYLNIMSGRSETLNADGKIIQNIDNQMGLFRSDMERDYFVFEKQLDNIFYQLLERGDRFFDGEIQLRNIGTILKKDILNMKFKTNVVEDVIQEVDKYMQSLIDFLIDRKYKQHKSIIDYISKKTETRDMIGNVATEFHFNRQDSILRISTALDHILRTKKIDNFENFNAEISSGVYTTIGAQIGAVGIGALSHLLLPTLAMELSGILAGLSVGVLGLYILPYKRNQMKKEFRLNIAKLNEKLKKEFKNHFDQDVTNGEILLHEAISPFSRFVRSEIDKLQRDDTELRTIAQTMEEIKHEIDQTIFREEDSKEKLELTEKN